MTPMLERLPGGIDFISVQLRENNDRLTWTRCLRVLLMKVSLNIDMTEGRCLTGFYWLYSAEAQRMVVQDAEGVEISKKFCCG